MASNSHYDPHMQRTLALSHLPLALRDIKIAHSVFALPFALLAAALAVPQAAPPARIAAQFALILICMVAARTFAMLINRLADRRFDAANPRTAGRAVATGALPTKTATAYAAAAAITFIFACAGFLALGNAWPLALAGPTLALVAFYSFTKRFTPLAHLFLGLALAASPIAAAIAIQPATLALEAEPLAPSGRATLYLAAFVALWVAAFDILYALQDLDFDRAANLKSIPAALGPCAAAWTSRALHALAFLALLAAIAAEPRLGPIIYTAAAIVAAALIAEHLVLTRRGLAGLPMAFFTLNGFIALTLGALGILDVLI